MSGVAPDVRLVVFDAGGVLVRLAASWEDACRRAGLSLRPDEAGVAPWTSRRALVEAYETGDLDADAFLRGVSEALGGRYTPGEVARVQAAWLLGEYPGVSDLVDAIHARDVATGMLSNTNAVHWAAMARYPTVARLRHPHASHLLRARKPAAAAFDRVVAAVGVRPSQTVFFDDLEENVAAARAAGWTAFVVDPAGDPAAQMTGRLRDLRVLP